MAGVPSGHLGNRLSSPSRDQQWSPFYDVLSTTRIHRRQESTASESDPGNRAAAHLFSSGN